ncbi:MAG: hypothetical protein IJU43_04405 [Lachnospiraceae bacterium]|nr:hypothetical protein [Lachnospiraceae bacterium]
MRITESSINMSSARKYGSMGARSGRISGGKSFEEMKEAVGSALSSGTGLSDPGTGRSDSYSHNEKDISAEGTDLYEGNHGYSKVIDRMKGRGISLFDDRTSAASQFQELLLNMLLSRFAKAGIFGGTTQQIITYQEYESTEFHADGVARTDDGRTISFNVDIMMSRSYMEYMNVYTPSVTGVLCDPLVINVGSDTADVKDQKFMFDIDADGVEDEISMLGRGSGFLALDKDGNGRIDDGGELFGAKSGNGFEDLREYDSDGNGWIDENDSIFEKLKVWCKAEDGEDILMDLKKADIGAIYLGYQSTEFSLNGLDGEEDGVIRSTGLFLRESMGVGTVQHVDMALGSNEEDSGKESGVGTLQVISFSGSSSFETETSGAQRRQNESRAKRRAVEKKNEARLQRKKDLERRSDIRRQRIRYEGSEQQQKKWQDSLNEQEMYEKRLNEGRDRMEQFFKDRFEDMDENKRFLNENIIDRLFEDSPKYSLA